MPLGMFVSLTREAEGQWNHEEEYSYDIDKYGKEINLVKIRFEEIVVEKKEEEFLIQEIKTEGEGENL